MRRQKRHGYLIPVLFAVCIFMMYSLGGCKAGKEDEEKTRDLEFSVIGESDAPQELQTIIAEKRQTAFKLTFTDDRNLYIAVGYGPQNTGGYSISVEELYLTRNAVVVDTQLMGPGKGEQTAQETSYPFIIIKTEFLENPVIFK